jgi:hypothetical protein
LVSVGSNHSIDEQLNPAQPHHHHRMLKAKSGIHTISSFKHHFN